MSATMQKLASGANARPSQLASVSSIHAAPFRPFRASQTIATTSRSGFDRRRQNITTCSWQRDPWDSSSRSRRRTSSSSSSSRDDKQFRFEFNQVDVSLAEDQLWRLAIPFGALFGLAIFIGPLIVGITVSAIALGAAVSAGALAFTTLLLPLIVLSGIGGLLSFGLFATVGAAFVIPKMIFSVLSLGFLGGGLLLGWGGVNWLLNQTATATNRGNASTSSFNRDQDIPIESESQDEQEFKRISSELREFDEILAKKDEQRRNKQWEGRGRY